MTVAVSTDNGKIDEDIKLFSQTLSDDDELIGVSLRVLLKEIIRQRNEWTGYFRKEKRSSYQRKRNNLLPPNLKKGVGEGLFDFFSQ